jgi:hypothetical protein
VQIDLDLLSIVLLVLAWYPNNVFRKYVIQASYQVCKRKAKDPKKHATNVLRVERESSWMAKRSVKGQAKRVGLCPTGGNNH